MAFIKELFMEILIIIPVVFVLSFILGGAKAFALAVLSSILSIVLYFIIGVNFIAECARFKSIPFGGCGYSDESSAMNVVFWFVIIFSMFVTGMLIWDKRK